ncbi:uncharacterized protein LOC129797543 isoform X2 [Lutzomyia longipalpis]|uniref:uncharacterized protein LOC129797543 isoform X2 n=1 Tax=Lutzomyia longipalpis TaxID=7200 RepID=UPI00248420CC|nr:uncharacterized protein LOC129797543 isoform X2 [Lutzomyia longipalpis]XP_055696225.1 uncharacterized protein LOC129797543 isoform X2 [Lutzomyia longipalpis]
MDSRDLVCLSDGQSFRAPMALPENQPEYPSEKFPNGFTGVPLFVSREKDINKVARSVAHGLNCDNLQIKEAVHFLYMVGLGMEEECPKDINCFGKPWLKKGEKVTPLTPFNIEFNDYLFDNVNPNPPLLVGENASLAFRIICIYRLHDTKHDTYKARLHRSAQEIIGKLRIKAKWRGTATPIIYNNWPRNVDFAKIVAGFDWFFVLFPDHPLAMFRFGSSMTHMAHCSVYKSLENTCKALNILTQELPYWIFHEKVLSEYNIVKKDSEFLAEDGSIVPYFACLRMSDRSPWAIEQVPVLHTWLNIMGCLTGSSIAKNAILPRNTTIIRWMIDDATLTVHAWASENESRNHPTRRGENPDFAGPKAATVKEIAQKKLGPAPKTHDPDEILGWYIKRGYELDDELKLANKHAVTTLVPLRLGTIGHRLYTMLIGPVPAKYLEGQGRR